MAFCSYCNSRIIKYSVTINSSNHHKVKKEAEWGSATGAGGLSKLLNPAASPYAFNIPHALALAEDQQ